MRTPYPTYGSLKGFWKMALVTLLFAVISADALAQVSGYTYRKRFVVNNAQVSGTVNLTNFPVLIDVTRNDLRTVANGGKVTNSNGYDIIFTSSDGTTRLNHQLESYNATTGRVVAWVRFPTLQATADTPFYIYFGNSSISTDQSTTATWETSYQMVHHYQNNTGDGTDKGNNGTDNGTSSAAGKIGNARQFGAGDFISVADNATLDITGDLAMSMWINPANVGSGPDLITKGAWNEAYTAYIRTNGDLRSVINGSRPMDSNTSLANNNWYHIVVTKTNAQRVIYINGVADATSNNSDTFDTNNNPLNISSNGFTYNGLIDEVRIATTVRSAAWYATEYANQNNPTAFISEVPEPPVLANIESTPQNFSAGGSPVNITSSITASDPFYTSLQGANIQITGNYVNGEDVLSFNNTASITGSWDSGTGTMTLSGSAGISFYETALRNVRYQNTDAVSPDQSTRTISFTVNNGSYTSAAVNRQLNILTDINDPSTDLANVVFHFDGQDVDGDLNTANQPVDGTGVASWGDRSDAATGGTSPDLSFTQSTGGLQPLFDSIYYGERGALFFNGGSQLNGLGDAILNTSNFTEKSFAAAFRTGANVSGLQVIYEQGGGVNGYQISVKDGNLYAYAWSSNGSWTDGDESINLGPVQPNTSYILTASHDANAGTWSATVNGGSLTFSAQTAGTMNTHGGNPNIGYEDGTKDPVTLAANPAGTNDFNGYIAELISWNTALSGGQMADLYTYLDEKWGNIPPVLAGIEGTTLDYNEGQAATSITSSITVSNADNTVIDSARVAVASNYQAGEDTLIFANTANITGTFDAGTGTLTLTGQDTKANYEMALRAVRYLNNGADIPTPGNRQISFTIYDWDDASNTVNRSINVIEDNTSPVLANIEGTNIAYTEGDGPVTITSAITVSDLDNPTDLQGATIQITGNYIQGDDLLDFTDTGSITSAFNVTTGTLTLTGTADTAAYRAALRAVTFENDSPNPVTLDRTVTFTVNDGTSSSNSQARDISITAVNSAPQLSGIESTALVYGGGDPPTVITNNITVQDFDDTNIEGATVQITGNYDNTQDVLAFSSLFGITGNWDAPSGTLTLSGSATVNDYQAALRTVTYENTSGTPSAPQRTVSFTVDDGALNSNTVTRNITVSIPAAISGLELWLKGDAGIGVSDGSPVATWADQSGNGRDFVGVPGSGSVPTFTASEPLLNGKPAVDFAGNGDFMEDADGESYINGLTEFTLFIVTQNDLAGSHDRGFWNTQIPDGQDDIFTYRYDENGANAGAVNLIKVGILNDDPANQLESFSDVQTTNGQITMLQWESGNVFDLYVDGVLNNPSGASTPPTGTLNNATTVIVGKGSKDDPDNSGNTTGSWDGRIAEVILYGRDLTATERRSVEDYLSEKYDISIRLLTPATGGEAISADDANTTFTPLTGPIIREEVVGKLQGGGTIVLKTPVGYEWDTGGADPTATVSPAFGGTTNLQVSFTSRTSTELTFTVDQASSSPSSPGKVTFGGLRVRPTTGVLPNTGNITNTGTTGQGGTTNYGTLNMVAGVKAGLEFAQQPTSNNVNENISPAIRVQLVDQFGNIVEEGGQNIDMALTTGTGTLSGTTTQATNTLGIAEFADLQIDQTGTGKQLTASSTGLTSVVSDPFDIVIAGQFTTFRVERAPSGNITPKTAGQNFDIKISAVDGNGDVDTGFNGTVSITSTGTLGSGGGTTAAFTNGVLSSHTVSITSTGNVKIIATNSSGSETGESNEFPVSPGAASATTSTITANPVVILNDGASTSTITVQLKDAFGNNLTTGGATVNLSTDNGSLGSVTDNGDGTYTATLTSSTSVVTATVTGTVNGNGITDNTEVDFAVFNAIWQSQLGSTDVASDWNDGVNWSSGTVPGAGDVILIPADPAVGNEYPVVDVTNQTVAEVSIETGADITVSGGVNFVIQGDLTGGGEVNGANNDTVTVGGNISLPSLPIGTVQLNGTAKQTVTSPHTYTNLVIDNAAGVDVSDNLFVMGTLSLTDGTLKIPSGKNLIANTKNIGSGNLAFERALSGGKGWRMISSPVSTTFGDLLDGIVTQGYANAFYGTGSLPGDTLQPNVLWYDETVPGTDNQRWRAPADANDPITAGQGLYIYLFGDVAGDALYDDALPDTLLATGQEHEGNGTEFDFNVTYTATADTGWNFVGNPFGATLNWDGPGWTKTNIDNTIYVWDPDANGGNGEYLTWNGTTGTLGNGLIAPYQGFWVKANGPSPVLKVQKTNKTTGGTFKRKQQNVNTNPLLALQLQKDGLTSNMNISFSPQGEKGKDPNDSYRLLPFTDSFLELYSAVDDGTQLVINNMPDTFEQRLLVPVHVGGYRNGVPISGVYTLSWPGIRNLPDDWILTLVDNETGDEVNMQATESYVFEIGTERAKAKGAYTANSSSGSFRLKEKAPEFGRFSIRISTQEIEDDIPSKIYLNQNYPNPFNPSTTITFGLDRDTDVVLEVYDILGRKVRTLIDDRLGAGVYPVTFDGAGLASGVYLYRLRTDSFTRVKKFTLIK